MCVLAATLLACCPAIAADDPAMEWTFGGFGSLGVAHSSESEADFTSSILKANGAGYTHAWSAHVDSRLGAQVGVKANAKWSAVVQVISEQRLDSSYRPIIEWANVKYQATPDLALRFGRIALPVFLAADYRKVGFAYPWVRVPREVYGAIPISNSDGVDVSYRWQGAGMKHVTQAFYGRNRIKLLDDIYLNARAMVGVSHTIEQGAFSGRFTAMTADITVNIALPLFDGLRQFGPRGTALADRYEVDHQRGKALSMGLSYDPGEWFAMAEIGRMNTRSFLGDTSAGYVSTGYRFDQLTPYLTLSGVRANTPTRTAGLPLNGLPPQLAGAAGALNGGLNALLATIPVQNTVSAGVRWDLHPNAALKLQFDRMTPRAGSIGTLTVPQPGFQSGHGINITSVVLDFVY